MILISEPIRRLIESGPRQTEASVSSLRLRLPPNLGRWLLNVALGIAAFITVDFIAAKSLKHGSQPYRQIERLLQEDPPYDTLFFGTSQINYHVNVSLFDTINASAGCPTHSWNLGAGGQDIVTIKDILRTIFAKHQSATIRTVFVEPAYMDLLTIFLIDPAANKYELYLNSRVIEMTHLSNLFLRFKLITGPQRQAAEIRYPQIAWGLVQLAAIRLTHAGYLNTRFLRTDPNICEYDCADPDDALFFPEKGYRQLKGYAPNFDPRYYENLRQWAALPTRPFDDFVPAPAMLDAIGDVMKLSREHGATPIILAPPQGSFLTFLRGAVREYHRRGPGTIILNYGDPMAYPALYADDVRWDNDHLNEQGAQRFTELLSQDFIKTNPARCRK
jgi:hypothetical protein